MKSPVRLIFALLVYLCAGAAAASFPHFMNLQGRLDDAAGDPLPDGNHAVTFRLFDVPSGGTALWTEIQTVTTVDGVFSVLLGSLDTIPEFVFYEDSLYLETQPDGSGPATPRARLSVVPYAWRARNADLLDGLSGTDLEESAEIQGAIAAHTAIPNAHHEKTISASELIIGTLAEGRLPQGAIDSTELEPESIGSDKTANETGLAHTFTQSYTLQATISVIDSAVITVPKSGWILVMANGTFVRDHLINPTNDCSATVSLSGSRISHNEFYSAKFSVIGGLPPGIYKGNFTVSQILPVGPGATKVYFLGDAAAAGSPNPRVENVHINSFYFPTAYGNIDALVH